MSMDIATGLLVFVLLLLGSCAGGIGQPSQQGSAPSTAVATPTGAPPSGASPSAEPLRSAAPASPVAGAAYQRLLTMIPEPIRAACRQSGYTEAFPPEPGELATADCTISSGPDGEFVSYILFDSQASMAAFQDIMRQGATNLGGVTGPGCFAGPGAGTGTWASGQRFCYQILTNDASVRWTHEALAIAAVASEDDGDWARLGRLWESAGPIAP
jgi:hypothetical protein